jgi:hypothetical protein
MKTGDTVGADELADQHQRLALLERDERIVSRLQNAIAILIIPCPLLNFWIAPIINNIEAVQELSDRLRSSGFAPIANGNFFLLFVQFILIFAASLWLEYRWRDARIYFIGKRIPDDDKREDKTALVLAVGFIMSVFSFAFGLLARTDGDTSNFTSFTYLRDVNLLCSAFLICSIYSVYRFSRLIEEQNHSSPDSGRNK